MNGWMFKPHPQEHKAQLIKERKMVMAKLHIICGNCGNSDRDLFEWEYHQGDSEIDRPEGVNLFCNNCGTLHDINDNAEVIDRDA